MSCAISGGAIPDIFVPVRNHLLERPAYSTTSRVYGPGPFAAMNRRVYVPVHQLENS